MPVELVSLEVIFKTYPGVDDPEKVKRYLHQAWYKRNAGYALLVGDADVFPVRYMVLDRITPEAFDYAFYPSDLYYADLVKKDGSFEDWNAQKDDFHAGYYGGVRGEKNKDDQRPLPASDDFYRLFHCAVCNPFMWLIPRTTELSKAAGHQLRIAHPYAGI